MSLLHSQVYPPPVSPSHPNRELGLPLISGRICEISGDGAVSRLSLAFNWVLEAQQNGEPVAWLTRQQSAFFPPDVETRGVDLKALVVIRVPDSKAIARAADKLARSAAFGLLILDLDDEQHFPRPIMSRLNHLCQRHSIALVCLTRKTDTHASLGALVSLRASTHRIRHSQFHFSCTTHVLKDKRFGPDARFEFMYRGPPGLP